jgi:peptide/nickel transport system permease protein/oligopeptide transport system permease protein
MTAYILRRLLTMIPVLLGVLLVVTVSLDLVPGDPAILLLANAATPESVAALRHELGLDRPFLVRFFHYLGGVLRGDLGRSITMMRPVSTLIGEALPATLELTAAALFLVAVGSLALGIPAAARPNSLFDNSVRILSLWGLSMPIFWFGILLILLFSLRLGLFPVSGRGGIRHLVLPALTVAGPSIGMLTRMIRSSILEVMQEAYITTAYAKGLPGRRVLLLHALRNSLIPIVTVFGAQMGHLLGGTVVTEMVFAWPGLGRLTVQAIFKRDYVLIQGIVLLVACTYVVINLLLDIAYGVINPRVRYD